MFAASVSYGAESADSLSTTHCCDTAKMIQPSYPGGQEALSSFFKENLIYPKQIPTQKGITGTVEVHFFVEKDGSVTLEDYKFINMNMKIEREEAAFFVKEVRRVFKLMKKWIPGSINGEPVRVKFRQKVNFKLPY